MPFHKHSSSSKRTPIRMSQHTFSQYPDEKMLPFYRWTSPPGVMKILSIIIIIMCVGVFVCVASTLVWDYDMEGMGMNMNMGMGMAGGSYGGSGGYYGSMGTGMGGGYGGSYGGYGGYGGYYINPLTGKGFMIAMAVIVFIVVLVIFILVISRQNAARSPKFYLAGIIMSAILAFFMLIATIVYLVAVNPMAQGSGSMMYNMMRQLCAQYQNQPQMSTGLFINQYMYHYCVVDPQEAVAIVLGFLVALGLIILMVFSIKTRSQMNRYGRHRVLWEEPRPFNDSLSHGVEKWVTDVSGQPEAYVNDRNDYIVSSRNYTEQAHDVSKPLYLPGDSDTTSTTIVLKGRARDYDTGDSADELDDSDYGSEFPPIMNVSERGEYKRQFDRNMTEYKRLQAELNDINMGLAEVDQELDNLEEGSPQFLDAMEVYSRLKSLKQSSEYKLKKKRTKELKSKLSLLKRRVSDYDRRA